MAEKGKKGMFRLKILSKEVTEKVLKMPEVIDTVKEVYRLKAEGKTEIFPLIFHEFLPGKADMDIKSGWIRESGIFGLKVVSYFEDNIQKGLPALLGSVLVMAASTGAPKGLLDGSHITGMRTGAAGAIGAQLLARKDAEHTLIVGAGHVAVFQIAAVLDCFPQMKEIMIYDGLSPENAKQLAQAMPSILREKFDMNREEVSFSAVTDLHHAVAASDIVITVTPSREPLIQKEWVKPGTHFSCIGADMAGKEEIDPEIFSGARIFTDDTPQCIEVGEIEIPIKKEILKREDIAGEIGDILTGKVPGRQNDRQITVFDATGTALLDLLTAELALKKAEEAGLGEVAEL